MSQKQKQSTQEASKANQVQQKVDEVIGIMNTNISKVVDRGEKISSLQDKTEELQNNSAVFKKTSHQVQTAMWWKDKKLMMIIGGVVITVIVIIAIAASQYQPRK